MAALHAPWPPRKKRRTQNSSTTFFGSSRARSDLQSQAPLCSIKKEQLCWKRLRYQAHYTRFNTLQSLGELSRRLRVLFLLRSRNVRPVASHGRTVGLHDIGQKKWHCKIFSFSSDIHRSGISLWALTGEVNNTNYLFIMAPGIY